MRRTFVAPWNVAPANNEFFGEPNMDSYRFSVIVPTAPMTHDEILDATDKLGNAKCTDASIRGHADGMELVFTRSAASLEAAISSAISDVEKAGYRISKVELEREAIPVESESL